MSNLRSIKPMATPGVQPRIADVARPEFTWVDPTDLLVDDTYQRNLSERSVALIRRIVGAWDWRRVKPIVCAQTEAGLEVIDGQHTAIAAASHPAVDLVPAIIVEASERADRAAAFLGHNRDRIVVTATQMHFAALAAGDEEALEIARVCERAGVTILKVPPGGGVFKPRQTMSVAAIGSLIRRRGVRKAREVLEVLAKAEMAPVSVSAIRAVEMLMTEDEYRGIVQPEDLTTAIRALGVSADQEAKVFASAHGVPLWRALGIVYFKRMKRRGSR